MTEGKCDMMGKRRRRGPRAAARPAPNVRLGGNRMMLLHGKGVSAGIAEGTLVYVKRADGHASRRRAEDCGAEWNRFLRARDTVVRQMEEMAEEARRKAAARREEVECQEDQAAGGARKPCADGAWLWEAYQLMAQDPEYGAEVERAVMSGRMNAEAAVEDVSAEFAERLEQADDEYMRSRAADVRDVSKRLIAVLAADAGSAGGESRAGAGEESRSDAEESRADTAEKVKAAQISGPVILAADDLTPGETLQLDRTRIAGFCTAGGSETGHTAILARTMGLAAVVGVGNGLGPELDGQTVLMDGETGEIVIAPDEAARKAYGRKAREEAKARVRLESFKDAAVGCGGGVIRICCNISSPDDLSAVLDSGADGVGLFRSEGLFLGQRGVPSEEEQYKAYRRVLEAMGERKVTIRTLDLGSDKQTDGLCLPREDNPALGLRGLRVSLAYPEIFRTQLRALYRASVFGRLRIMFPMVTDVRELREAKRICEQVREELEAEGIPAGRSVPVGIMIETPAAALMSGELAAEADFFSCGTNDLTQYTLACDRQNGSLERYYDPRHPAVLRLLAMTAENARKAGIRIGVCGELAADREMAEFWLSAGIDELSVPPRSVLPLRERFSELSEGK